MREPWEMGWVAGGGRAEVWEFGSGRWIFPIPGGVRGIVFWPATRGKGDFQCKLMDGSGLHFQSAALLCHFASEKFRFPIAERDFPSENSGRQLPRGFFHWKIPGGNESRGDAQEFPEAHMTRPAMFTGLTGIPPLFARFH